MGIWSAQVIIAMAFAVYHVLNGWGVFIAFTGTFVWAFVFGLSALWSKGIAMPTGIHIALNAMQNLAGMKNNGAELFKLAYKEQQTKEVVATADYTGIGLHITILIIALLLTEYYRRKQKFV